jgi:hypothetical protein
MSNQKIQPKVSLRIGYLLRNSNCLCACVNDEAGYVAGLCACISYIGRPGSMAAIFILF